MANGKAMTVGEMASLFLDPATPVRIDAFDGSHFGPADADLKVKIATPNCMYQLLAHPNEIGIVRSYILGDFDVDGIDYADPYPAMRKLVSLAKYVRPLTPTSIARVSAGILSHGFKKPPVPATEGPSKFARIKRGLMPHTEKADSETVSFHYDMSNEFYADFLGSSISKEQAAYANEWIAREGLQDLAEVRVQDYREVPEHDFDGICSIGMMEHVGVKNYQSYFEEMFRLLKPMGRLLNHQITISHDKPHGKPGTDEFLDRYIFPDGDLGAPGFIESCIHDAGFNVVHQENLRQHYALTLHHWNQNLSEHWDDAVKQVGFERAKVWGMYMAACALNFELDGIQIHQFLAVKPDRVAHPDGKWYPLRQWWQA